MSSLFLLFANAVLAAEPPITSLAFSPDGNSLVVGSQSGLAEYDWPELTCRRQLRSSLVSIHDLTFSPGGQWLAVAGGVPAEQGIAEILSWPAGEVSFRCDGHDDTVQAVAWRNDQTFATASLDHEVGIWKLGQPQSVRRLKGHSKGVTTLTFVSEGSLLLSGGIDQNLRVWDVDRGKLIRTLNNHTRAIHGVSPRPSLAGPSAAGLPMAASISDDRTVRLWQPTIGRMVRFARLSSIPLAITWLPDGSRIAVACSDGRVRLIDPDTAQVADVVSAHVSRDDIAANDDWVYSLAAHPRDGTLVVGGRNGMLRRVLLERADGQAEPSSEATAN